MQSGNTSNFNVIENLFIPLKDGRRLAARLWMPEIDGDEKLPAVLEYLPYRKRDGTAARDDSNYPVFAEAGIVGVRVDISGNGDSDGHFDDEYSSQELDDGEEVIAWIADQDWSNGSVGVMGISWGGFNGLQLAARQPPALKAVISIGSTVDRYNDDIHYKNGCHLSANMAWSANMLCYAARAPDPLIVGDQWRDMWLSRLASQPFPLAVWLSHQTRDAYWQHGSVCEDFSAVKTPVLIISGWSDGYINAPPAGAQFFSGVTKAINGPWIHKYPHFAWPKPRMDFHSEAIQWWKQWLAGEALSVETWPAYRAYLSEGVRPFGRREEELGHWVAESSWPSSNTVTQTWFLCDEGQLDVEPSNSVVIGVSSAQDCGTACGEYFALTPEHDLPGDQQIDDHLSQCFDSAPLMKATDVLGQPTLVVRVKADRSRANIVVRLIDVHPDGVAHRVSWGCLNLCHRKSHECPESIVPGEWMDVKVVLDHCGYRFLPGHKIRLSVSNTYWPMILPSPYPVALDLQLGEGTHLLLPCRAEDSHYVMNEPVNPNPLPEYVVHQPGESKRWVEQNPETGMTHYRLIDDTGETEIDGHKLIVGERRVDDYSIDPLDPTSLRLRCEYSHQMSRGEWQVKVETLSELTCDEQTFFLTAKVCAYESGVLVHERHWEEQRPREYM